MIRTLIFLLLSSVILKAQNSLENLKEPFYTYTVSTTECSRIVHSSGTVIFIPDLAFQVDTEQVNFVQLLYREMKDPIDMLVNNYNMFIELMGKRYFLESSGMFEIFAKYGDDTIHIHEDRSIFVYFASKAESIDPLFEAFKYNFSKDLWDSYDRIGIRSINENDDNLWGSSPIRNEGSFLEEEWIDEELLVQDSLRKVAFQVMEIYDFGVYNYDKIIKGETYIPIIASFKDQNGNKVSSPVYVIYDEINSVFSFDQYSMEDFFIIKDREYNMFALDKEGRIHKLMDYPEFTQNQDQQITFKLIDQGALPDSKGKLSYMIKK